MNGKYIMDIAFLYNNIGYRAKTEQALKHGVLKVYGMCENNLIMENAENVQNSENTLCRPAIVLQL